MPSTNDDTSSLHEMNFQENTEIVKQCIDILSHADMDTSVYKGALQVLTDHVDNSTQKIYQPMQGIGPEVDIFDTLESIILSISSKPSLTSDDIHTIQTTLSFLIKAIPIPSDASNEALADITIKLPHYTKMTPEALRENKDIRDTLSNSSDYSKKKRYLDVLMQYKNIASAKMLVNTFENLIHTQPYTPNPSVLNQLKDIRSQIDPKAYPILWQELAPDSMKNFLVKSAPISYDRFLLELMKIRDIATHENKSLLKERAQEVLVTQYRECTQELTAQPTAFSENLIILYNQDTTKNKLIFELALQSMLKNSIKPLRNVIELSPTNPRILEACKALVEHIKKERTEAFNALFPKTRINRSTSTPPGFKPNI